MSVTKSIYAAFGLALAVGLAGLSLPAHAATKHKSGDLLVEEGWTFERPAVPSDAARGSDMFGAVPLFSPHADVFDGQSGRLPQFPRPDMFAPQPSVTPPDVLFQEGKFAPQK